MKSLCAYIINLDRAPERWAHIQDVFAATSIPWTRVPAIDGKNITLPCPDFNAPAFRWFHGREINVYEIACFYSHMKALRLFLESDHEYALICEDDICLKEDMDQLLAEALKNASYWNILRLSGLHPGKVLSIKKLSEKSDLSIHMGRLKGCGSYLVDRKAARCFLETQLPMWLPWDHAMDREWLLGLKALSIAPFPISQNENKFKSTIQQGSQPRLSELRRSMTTYPYQALNEVSRWIFRICYFCYLKARVKLKLS